MHCRLIAKKGKRLSLVLSTTLPLYIPPPPPPCLYLSLSLCLYTNLNFSKLLSANLVDMPYSRRSLFVESVWKRNTEKKRPTIKKGKIACRETEKQNILLNKESNQRKQRELKIWIKREIEVEKREMRGEEIDELFHRACSSK